MREATRAPRARGDPGRAVARPTWASSRRARASSSCCASAPTTTGALLVFDEVITGFRVARGGAQELYGVAARPHDHGQGRSAAACRRPPTAARATLMERIAPAGDVYQAGTLSGNPLAVAAGLATLRAARRRAPTPSLPRTTEPLADGLRTAAAQAGVPVQVAGRPGPADRCSSADAAGARLRGRGRLRPARPTAPGAARCSRAASTRRLAVRGLVPVARPHRRRRRAHARGRRGGAFAEIGSS